MKTVARVLCLVQLPPPVHGASVVNQQIVESETLASRFDLDPLPLQFATTIDDLSSLSLRKLARAVNTAGRLIGRLVTKRPDLVYFTVSPTGAAFYRDVAYISILKAFRVPRVFHMHGKGIARQLDRPLGRALASWAFDGARVIHLSPRLASDTDGVVAPDDVVFVANGIPDAAIVSRRASNAVPRILFLSHMVETKGPLVLVEALAGLAGTGAEFEATFAGARFRDGCVARFERAVEAAGLTKTVKYVGPVHGSAKRALYADHDVFVLPSFNDAFPLVLLEAMQNGLPVVSTLEGAIPEIVVHGETGLLVAPRDPVALAGALSSLLAEPERRTAMGGNGRRRYVERFTLQHFERSLAAALETCIEAGR